MFALTDGMHYYLCQHYVDMRKGMTGLYRLVKAEMSVLFSIRNDWKKAPLRFPVLIPIQGLMSSPGRLFF